MQRVATGGGDDHEAMKSWKDVCTKVWDDRRARRRIAGLKSEKSGWKSAEEYKHGKWNKGDAKKNAAGRGGHGTFGDIGADALKDKAADFGNFVKQSGRRSTMSTQVRSLLSPIVGRKPPAPKAPAGAVPAGAATAATPAPATTRPTPAPVQPAGQQAPATPACALLRGRCGRRCRDDAGCGAERAEQRRAGERGHRERVEVRRRWPGADAAPCAKTPAPTTLLPYWPALLPQFAEAQHDFGYMRNVAVEFKKAQIDGKQKAADTLAIYGKYDEYAKLRQKSAAANKQEAVKTGNENANANVSHAAGGEGQAGTGEGKQQRQARGAANSKVAQDIPEPESRGFWGRILGRIKIWARNKAAAVFGWIQDQVASLILKGLCGVSMGDLKEYAGAMRGRQQSAAKTVATTAQGTSDHAVQASIKLSGDANKEAQGAADAMGECDSNIQEADKFMADVASFEQQLAEEKALAEIFIAQVRAASHVEQAKRIAQQQQHAQEEQKTAPGAGLPGGAGPIAAPATAPAPTPAPTPDAAPDGGAPGGVDAAPGAGSEHDQPDAAPDGDVDSATIQAAAGLVISEGDNLAGQLDSLATDYTKTSSRWR